MKYLLAPVLVTAALLFSGEARGQNSVLRIGAAAGPTLTAATRAGAVPVRTTPIRTSPELLIVIAKDTLDPGDYDAMRRFIADAYKSNRATVEITLAILRSGSGLDVTGGFRSQAELQTVLRKTTPDDNPPQPQAVTDFFGTLTAALTPVPSSWGCTLVIGRIPVFDAAVDPLVPPFAAARLTREFIGLKRRLLFYDPSGREPSFLAASIAANTGGSILHAAEDLGSVIDESVNLATIEWDSPPLTRGFDPETVQIGGVAAPSLNASSPTALPSIERYTEMRVKVREARALAASGDTNAARASLAAAFEINPAERDAVQLGIELAERDHDPPGEIALLEISAELNPKDAALWTKLGSLQYFQNDFRHAEPSLLRARELGASGAASAAQLGQIAYGRGDLAHAADYLDESLRFDNTQQPLWLLAAELAGKAGNTDKRIDALEHGLALGGSHIPLRIQLIELYLARGDRPAAARHADLELPRLPADPDIQTTWAGFYERLERPEDALACWKRVIAADARREPAHFEVANILLARKDYGGALAASEAGFEADMKSGRLELIKVDSLQATDRIYEARRSLDDFAPASGEIEVLRHHAELSDVFGGGAPGAWVRYTDALLKSGAVKSETAAALERGFRVSVREHDNTAAAWFQTQIAGPPKEPAAAAVSAVNKPAAVRRVFIPGGLDALAFIAHGQSGSLPGRFLVDYCRTILAANENEKSREAALYRKSIAGYFDQLRQLLALSAKKEDRAVLTLSLLTKQGQSQTEGVLNILGWKLRRAKGQVTVEAGEKAEQSEKQDVASALAIDRGAMQSAFQAGRPFALEIPLEWADVNLDAATWQTMLQADKYAGGMAESLSQNMDYARLFIGLNNVDAPTASLLVYQMNIHTQLSRYGRLLALYSPALAVSGGHAQAPGGPAAEAVWAKFAGAAPADPARFFRALFDRDEGRALAWFFALSQLDLDHQRFFTRTPERMEAFYRTFEQSQDLQAGASHLSRNGSFSQFLREIPLNGESVDFPGSAEVWMVAKGRAAASGGADRMLRKARKAAAPDVEDEILLRLARTRNKKEIEHISEVDNFLAVARIDAHRTDPLDDESALVLAQNYDEFESFYPYFTVFRGLTSADYRAFFEFLSKMKTGDAVEADLVLGQFESLLEIFRLSIEFGGVPEDRATALFRATLKGFSANTDVAVITACALDAVRGLIAGAPADADTALRNLVLGPAAVSEVEWKGATLRTDNGRAREIAYGRVLDLQKTPALAALLRMDDAARRIASGKGAAADLINGLQKDSDALPRPGLVKIAAVDGHAKHALERTNPAKIAPIIAELRQKAAKKKVNPKDLENLCRELMRELAPQTRIALAGVVYGVYFSPDSILVSNDPLLTRKHQSFELRSGTYAISRFPLSRFQPASAGEGSFFVGGFAQLAVPAATASAAVSQGTNTSLYIRQMAALRMTPWAGYGDAQQRLLGLKIRMAREWCVYVADDPALLAALGDDMHGVLSLTRRRAALNGIASRDWDSVWDSVTLSDLLFLADRYLARYGSSPWKSPVDAELRRVNTPAAGERLQLLASVPSLLYGCAHPHLLNLGPYEEYERQLFPGEIAERTAEMKFYLAEALDRYALPAAAIAALAEPVARRVFGGMRMSDERDWAGAIKAFRGIDDRAIGMALEALK